MRKILNTILGKSYYTGKLRNKVSREELLISLQSVEDNRYFTEYETTYLLTYKLEINSRYAIYHSETAKYIDQSRLKKDLEKKLGISIN